MAEHFEIKAIDTSTENNRDSDDKKGRQQLLIDKFINQNPKIKQKHSISVPIP